MAVPQFPPASSGGTGGTVTTSAPVSGDGSAGSPVTVAAGALPLTAVAAEAASTLVGNATGGSASPVALTVAQVQAMLGITGTDAFYASALVRIAAIGGLTTTYSKSLGIAIPTTSLLGLDGHVEGGGVTTSGSTRTDLSEVTILQSPKTKKWYLKLRSICSGINSAGAMIPASLFPNSGANTIEINNVTTSVAPLNWVLRVSDGTNVDTDTGVVAATGFHDFEIWCDGTAIFASIDASAPVSVALTHAPTIPATPAIGGNTTGPFTTTASRMVLAYQAP